MDMKKKAILWRLALAGTILAGCCTSKSPYDYLDNWLIREEAVRPFAVPTDIIYVQDRLYRATQEIPEMQTWARDAVGRGRFEGIARVFAPLVSCLDDVEMAVTWYVKHHNTTRRPFVLIGEGQGGELLKTFAEENREWLVEKGFVASFYSKTPDPHFVSDEMIRMIKIRSAGARYQREWGRVVPEGLLEK